MIVILSIAIVIAMIPYGIVISRNLASNGSQEQNSTVEETPEATEPESINGLDPDHDIDLDTEPDPDPEPLPEPEPSPDPDPEPEAMQEDRVLDISEHDPDLADRLDEIAEEYNCAAVSLVIYDGDTGEYYTYHYGYADIQENHAIDENTKFRVASLSKLTTVLCAMVLVDEGELDLDEDISTYLGYNVTNRNHPDTPITTRMLMQHTSSIFDSDAFDSSRSRNSSRSNRQLLDAGSSFRNRRPGLRFEYTNLGYSILAAVCEMISGKSINTLSREVLFTPLGIDAAYVPSKLTYTGNIAVIYNSRHSVSRSVQSQLDITESATLGHDNHLAQGNLTISAIDYAKILAMLRNDGILHGIRVLSPEAVKAIHDTDVTGVTYDQGLGTRYSNGSFISGEGSFWHTGSAYGTFAQYIYSADINNRGVVVVTTGSNTERRSSGLLQVCTDLSVLVWENIKFNNDN